MRLSGEADTIAMALTTDSSSLAIQSRSSFFGGRDVLDVLVIMHVFFPPMIFRKSSICSIDSSRVCGCGASGLGTEYKIPFSSNHMVDVGHSIKRAFSGGCIIIISLLIKTKRLMKNLTHNFLKNTHNYGQCKILL